MADRLLRSLDEMQDDYARTVSAQLSTEAAQPVDLRALVMEELPVDSEAATSDPGGDGEEDDDGDHGYAMIGSDDGGSERADSDTEHGRNVRCAKAPRALATFDQDGENPWKAAAADADFEDFQDGGFLESFADFGSSNPALPSPPPGMSQFEATPLTDDQVQFIKEAMKQVEIIPPLWAQNLDDRELNRKIREALRGGV
mmetsp:Transcript_95618/g.252667  ORF Transcript_95618/g.252667 Transcript_95618/m.252667 type:complete len:200 (+) Transcript_95618:767-1366(+)